MAPEQIILVVDRPTLIIIPEFYYEIISEEFGFVRLSEFETFPEKYVNRIEGILLFPKTRLNLSEDFIRRFPKLKVIANHGVGVNHIDVPLLRKHNIKLSNTPEVLSDACADHAFLLILASARRLKEALDITTGLKALTFLGTDVCHMTLGIMGMGDIGFKVAERSKGFKMKVLYYNRNQRSEEDECRVGAVYCSSLATLLPQVDFLVICAPLNPETHKCIGAKELSSMKSTAILINASRGEIVDTDALVEALKDGTIRAAALDATDPEPLPEYHPLRDMPNVIITPHMSSGTVQARSAMIRLCLRNLKAGLEDKPMPNEVYSN